MKKNGILALVIALTAALAIGCIAPVDGSLSGGPDKDYTPPEGMGAVYLNFGSDTNARATILPDTVVLGDFDGFYLEFTATSVGNGEDKNVYLVNGTDVAGTAGSEAIVNPISLEVGSYNLTVTAYFDDNPEDTGVLPGAVYTSASPIPVNTGVTTSHAVTLRPFSFTAGTDDGTFTWTITNSVSRPLTAASVSFTPITEGATVPAVNLTPLGATSWTNSTSPLGLTPGIYSLVFSLTSSGKTIYNSHLLYVYQNMNSSFSLTFENDHFGFAPPGSANGGFSYVHPSVATNPMVYNPQDTSPTDPPGPPPVPNPIDGNGTLATPFILEEADQQLTIEITNPGDFTGIIWLVDGPIAQTSIVAGISGTDNEVFELNYGDAQFSANTTPYRVTTRGTTSPGGLLVTNADGFYILIK